MEVKEKYYEIIHEDLFEGLKIKFNKLDAIAHIELLQKNTLYDKQPNREFISECLYNVLWSKDGTKWNRLVGEDGSSRLDILDDNPQLGFDIFIRYKTSVINPVFLESKTYQSLKGEIQE